MTTTTGRALLLVTLLASLFASCGTRLPVAHASTWTYAAEFSSPDVICLRGTGEAPRRPDVLAAGVRSAFAALLLRGIPDSPYRAPLVTDPDRRDRIQRKLAGTGYRDFPADAWLLVPPDRPRGQATYSAPVRVNIDLNALRRSLEREGLLPRFGL